MGLIILDLLGLRCISGPMKSKGRPRGPEKVVFKRRVLATTVPKLDDLIKELESLVHAATPAPAMKPGDFVGKGPDFDMSTGKVRHAPSAIQAKEVVAPKPVERPNFFKKP